MKDDGSLWLIAITVALVIAAPTLAAWLMGIYGVVTIIRLCMPKQQTKPVAQSAELIDVLSNAVATSRLKQARLYES